MTDLIWLRPESTGVGRPAEHTRADVTAAAIALAAADGFGAVSMRRVAGRLGTGAASLYRYVRNRDELLQLMADAVYHEIRLEPTGRGPRADLVQVGLEGFRVTMAHPWFADLLADPSFLASGPGVARLVEYSLSLMADEPISGPRKIEVVGLSGAMVQQFAGLVLRQQLPEQLAAQMAYLAHVAQDGEHPHLAAAFGSPPEPDGATPEEGLRRMLTFLFDGVFGAEVVLTATRANVWSFDHNIALDGRPLCRWSWHGRSGQGAFELDGHPWAVRTDRRRSPFHLVDARGVVIAFVEEGGKRQPDLLHVEGRVHPVQDRSGLLRRECALLDGEQVIGHVKRQVGLTEAHLPTLHLPAQMLLLGVLLARWDAEAQSAG